MNLADQEYCIGRGIAAIKGKEGISDTMFIYYYLERESSNIFKIATGGVSTFPNITAAQLRKYLIVKPHFREQIQIAVILSFIDDTIAAARSSVEASKALKMRLINQLLSVGDTV